MSDWHGPSTYFIASAHDTKCRVSLHYALKDDGTKVITWYVVPSRTIQLEILRRTTHARNAPGSALPARTTTGTLSLPDTAFQAKMNTSSSAATAERI
jgi:hypothetical protein